MRYSCADCFADSGTYGGTYGGTYCGPDCIADVCTECKADCSADRYTYGDTDSSWADSGADIVAYGHPDCFR